MPLDISRALRMPGETFPFRHEEGIPPQDILGDEVSFPGPAVLEGQMCLTGSSLRLWGKLKVTAQGSCANCLAPATHEVRVSFDEVFVREGTSPKEEEDFDDQDRFAFDGPQLAVDQLALTLAVLDLPIRLLCRDECPGFEIAPPLNQTHAGQKESPDEHPFSALQQLLNKDQEV